MGSQNLKAQPIRNPNQLYQMLSRDPLLEHVLGTPSSVHISVVVLVQGECYLLWTS